MKFIFVYNADSGVINTVKDIGHKLFNPQTYDCFLCSLTHGTFRENPEWREFCDNIDCEMIFLHRDEFEQSYQESMEYPVVLKENDSLEVAISREQLASYASLDNLMDAVKQQIEVAR